MVNLCKIAESWACLVAAQPSRSVRFACGENLEMEALPVKVIPSYVDVGKVRTDLEYLSIVVSVKRLAVCRLVLIYYTHSLSYRAAVRWPYSYVDYS